MDAGAIFLISFIVVFGSLLVGGWWCGHPLLMLWTRLVLPRRPPQQSRESGSQMARRMEESPRTRSDVRRYNLSSWKHLTHHQSVASRVNDETNHSPQALPASSTSSTFSQPQSSCSILKVTELDVVKQPHDLCNMLPVPPVPKQGLSRRVAEIGTQAPLGALLARRSQDTLMSQSSNHSAVSGSGSCYGDTLSPRAGMSTPPFRNRTRTMSDAATPSPLRQASRPNSSTEPVPPIPAHVTTTARVKETAKASWPQTLPITPVVMKSSEDVEGVAKPNQEQMDAAEFRVNTANFPIKTPRKVHQAGPSEHYKFKNLLSVSPSPRKPSPPQMDAFRTPPSQWSLNLKTRSTSLPFTDSIERLARRAKATPGDEEASPSIKITISGPSSYVPNIGSGWSPNEYLMLHNAKQIENPLIEHPPIGPQHFHTERARMEKGEEQDTSMMISHELRQLDYHYGHKMGSKGRYGRSTPATAQE